MPTRSNKLSALLVAMSAVALVSPNSVFAQSTTATKESKALELEAVQRKLEETRNRQTSLEEEIQSLNQDVGAINRALIETAKRGQELEGLVDESENRLGKLLNDQSKLKNALSKKKNLLSELLASLQRLGKNPPPALFIQPKDALASVRSSILLGAVVPTIKQETDVLFAELAALKDTALAIEKEKANLSASLNALAEDETRLSLLIEEKNQLASRSSEDLLTEQNKAAELAAQALTLKQLITDLESQITSAAEVAKRAKIADEERRQEEQKRLEATRKKLAENQNLPSGNANKPAALDMARIKPAISFKDAKGKVLLPVKGVQIAGFGASSGGNSRTNVALATRTNARVRAPNDGWIVYAGKFRSYGNIVIINAGEGYHMILTGMSETNAVAGQFVLAGEPIGRMGSTSFAVETATNLGSNKPILTVELRKDSKPIDPSPWWAEQPSSNTKISSSRGT